MIFLSAGNSGNPSGSLYASNVTIGGATFSVWWQPSWANAGKGTASFVFTAPQSSVDLDFYPFMQYMIAQGWLQPSWYLVSIQAGFEIWEGGGLAVDSFTVSIAPPLPAGNLFCSIAGVAGTDIFGNAYGAGLNVGDQQGGFIGMSTMGDFVMADSSGVPVAFWYHGDGSLRFCNTGGITAGNLIASIAPAAGTDSAGNDYPAGLLVGDLASTYCEIDQSGNITATGSLDVSGDITLSGNLTTTGTDLTINSHDVNFANDIIAAGNVDCAKTVNTVNLSVTGTVSIPGIPITEGPCPTDDNATLLEYLNAAITRINDIIGALT